MPTRADIARRLWNDYLKVEYYALSELARDEWDPEKASHSVPRYYPNGDRVVGEPEGEFFEDETYLRDGARDEHYAVRTYILDTEQMGCQLVIGRMPNSSVFGQIESNGRLPQGIPLVGRIMGVLGYKRGTNNLGETYFSLNSPTGERAKNMFADAVHFEPPEEAPELPKQFVSQIHIQDLRTTHPKLADYIEAMMRIAPDPMQGLEDVMEKLSNDEEVSEEEAHEFLEAAGKSIKERPWKLPLETATAENWDEEVAKLEEVLAEHNDDPTEASICRVTTSARSSTALKSPTGWQPAAWMTSSETKGSWTEICIRKARQSFATSLPIRPKPMIRTCRPPMSIVSRLLRLAQSPVRVARSKRTPCLARCSIMKSTCSATEVALASVVSAMGMPRRFKHSRSTLSKPTPWRETTFSRSPRSSTSAGRSAVRIVTPSASTIFACISSTELPSTIS